MWNFHFPIWFHHIYLNDTVWRRYENQEKPNKKWENRKLAETRYDVIVSECLIVSNPVLLRGGGGGGCMLVLLACGLAQSVSEYGNEYVFRVYVLYLGFRQTTHALVCMNISRSETKTILRVWNRCSETITEAGKCVLNCQNTYRQHVEIDGHPNASVCIRNLFWQLAVCSRTHTQARESDRFTFSKWIGIACEWIP